MALEFLLQDFEIGGTGNEATAQDVACLQQPTADR
jgi:hypothetical protein